MKKAPGDGKMAHFSGRNFLLYTSAGDMMFQLTGKYGNHGESGLTHDWSVGFLGGGIV
jgi:hypothetical protein